MSISRKLKNAASGSADGGGGGGTGGTYVDDVFSTYVYEGNSVNDRPIVNGIDLAGEGGLVWLKHRSGTSFHYLYDTERGTQQSLSSNDTGAAFGSGLKLKAFNSDGFDLGGDVNVNNSGEDYASWTFRKAPKFFDVVKYTGTGVSQEIPHNLGIKPGMIIAKKIDGTGSWWTWHGSLPNSDESFSQALKLDDTSAAGSFRAFGLNEEQTESVFKVSGVSNRANDVDAEYVAYVFAHDDSDESMIKCGSFTGTTEVDLGWEPQYILTKVATSTGNWQVFDAMRGIPTGMDKRNVLRPNLSSAESTSNDPLDLTPTGFNVHNPFALEGGSGTADFIYMAIRRPNKPAEEFDPEELFAVNSRGADNPPPSYRSNFVVDAQIRHPDLASGGDILVFDRLRGSTKALKTNASSTESSAGSTVTEQDQMEGIGSNNAVDSNDLSWMWRRAPGFFDVVNPNSKSYKPATNMHHHNLGVAPELIIAKCRDFDQEWIVGFKGDLSGDDYYIAMLNENTAASQTDGQSGYFAWGNHNEDTFYSMLSGTARGYIHYLFASVPGISKVGSYTGNGSEVEVDCGFTTGARWLLVKRVDSTGDWYFTSNPNNFKTLAKLNTTDAQSNYMSTYNDVPAGFRVTSTSANLCVDGAEYIFYAIA